jgi:hypothetical protein
MKALLRSPLLWINLAIATVLLGNPVWRELQARDKLQGAGLAVVASRVDISVDLGVTPEQFHMSRLQKWGTMVGAQERSVRLRGVSSDNLQQIARQSWVQGIRRLQP